MPIASELTIDNTASALTLAQTIFGAGVSVTSATLSGAATQSGTFSGGDATLGDIAVADTGIILSTGDVAAYTNSSGTLDTNTTDGTSTSHSGAGDADLDTVSGQTTFDAVTLNVDFTATSAGYLTMQFTFSSEEYLEYVSGGVNDAFGVWVNGTYVPFTPATNDLVSIDTINNASSSNLYLDNPAAADTYNTEMDGATITLSIKAPVVAGANTMKIALADGGDGAYDSNVLIAADSVQTFALAFDDAVTMETNTSISIDVLANDTDTVGSGLTISEINGNAVTVGVPLTLPTGEIVTLNADGTVSVQSDGDVGSETFTYTVVDGAGNSDVGFLTINTVADIPLDYIVEGTGGNDTIDATYTNDPEGDQIDNLDSATGGNDDSVQAGGGDDVVSSGLGNDTIDAGTGNDSVTAGSGNDSVIGGDGNDTVFGEAGDDTILGGSGADSLDADGGNDSVDGGIGNDTIIGDAGNDTLLGGADNDEIYVSSGNNLIDGGSGSDSIFGGSDADTIDGGTGADAISGGGGDDLIELNDGFGADTITGGETGETAGDTLDLSGTTTGVTVDMSGADPEAGTVSDGTSTATFSEIENIALGGGRDTVVLADGSGSDTVSGFDTADSGDGTANDQLDVSGLTSDGGTTPVTTDDVTVTDDGAGNAVLTFPGGESITLVGVAPTSVDSAAELEAIGIPAAVMPLDYIVEGTGGDDTIDVGYTGDPEGDQVDNSDAADGSQDDVIEAYGGNDSVDAGLGNDSVDGGSGNDTIFGAAGDDTILGGTGADSIFGNEGNDSILGGDGADTIDGGTGNDTILGGDGGDSINGGSGDDVIQGGLGDDFLRGSFGNDSITGNVGNDTLWGGFGDDTLVVDPNFGDYTIEGEEEAETTGDTMDVSGVTSDLTWDLTGANPEAGSFTDGVHTGTYVDIENIVLGSGTDTLVLDTFGGSDRVSNFEAPTDLGGGVYSGNDQLDVSGLTDFDGNATHTGNVTVTDDGSGNAVLTFPNGESLTLTGVPVSAVSSPAQLIAMGIPEGPDGYVDGTAGDDTIDVSYTGDPNFDRVDADDALLPGAAPNDDYIRAGAGNDSVSSNAGNDTVELDAGNDTADGGFGDDTIDGGTGEDSIIGGLGNDSLVGGAGNDTLNGQIGADVLEGGDGSDTFALEDDFGNDTIVGGEVDDAASGDTLDMSGLGGGLTYDLTGTDAESGTVSDGTSTLSFSEIENIQLSGGIDTLVLDNGSGDDTVSGFTPPFDDGFGTWVGIDQVDVSSMIDGNGAPVNTGDVTVTDDGSGNAVLNFPGGESLTLIGVPPSAFPVPEALAAIGIPLADYIVEGTGAGELIDGSYLGDPEGDIVDAGDGDPLLANADSDSIEAGAGNDTVFAGVGDDTVQGGEGDDLINGEAGDDSLIGGLGNDSVAAGSGNDTVLGNEGNDSINGGAGDDSVEGGSGDDLISGAAGNDTLFGGDGDDTFAVFDGFGDDTIVGSEIAETTGDTMDLSGIAGEGVSITYTGDESGVATGGTTGDTVDFSEIENVTATDNDDTIDASADGAGVNIDAGAGDDSIIGGTGLDTIEGGAGNDTLSGGEGADSIIAGTGDDTINVAQGDTVTGGDGDDYFNIVDLGETDTDTITIVGGEGDETDGDTLALNGLHDRDSLTITDPDDVNGGLSGSVTLLDGTVVNFTNIENIICFVEGSQIATPMGLRKIEDLRIGDPVLTQDNGVQHIRWIGSSTVDGTGKFAPVKLHVPNGGLGDELLVSPQHRMLFKGYQAELMFGESEVLVPAKHLVDGITGEFAPQETVTYVHMMFDQHEIVFANGLPTESFHPGEVGVDSLEEATRDELFALFPELRSDLTLFGPSARLSLKSREAVMLQSFFQDKRYNAGILA